MRFEEALRDGALTAGGTFLVDGPVVVSDSFVLAEAELRFTSSEACLTLQGPGPFRFANTRFLHEESLAPTLVRAQDAWVGFASCHFQGANGGTEEALSCALVLQGQSMVQLEDCSFEDNDLHLEARDEACLRLTRCHLRQARADALRGLGRSRLSLLECELVESGWCGMLVLQSCVAEVTSSRLSGNGCHGLYAAERTRLQTARNSLTGNRQHGILLAGKASLVSCDDHLAANDLCGLDGSEQSLCVLSDSEAYGNESHGLQLRGQASAVLRGCRLGDNEGSGLALFDESTASATQLVAEANSLNGAQCGGNSRLSLSQAEVLGNCSSGLACFGQSVATVESSTLGGSQGYAAQLSETGKLRLWECYLSDNRKGGLLLANQADGWVSACTLSDNGQHGVAVSDAATISLSDSILRNNARDGVLLLGSGRCEILRNQLQANGRHGLYASGHARPLLDDNSARDNAGEQLKLENAVALSVEQLPSLEETPGVTLTAEDGGNSLFLPFQPKPIEESLLLALLRHGRLTEAALGRAAKSRRVGGAMENLIDRLNKAGLPVLRHEGDGPEGNVYALRLDTTRQRVAPGSAAEQQGRNAC
jgi:parallel beta-helix repeat protein